VTLRVNTRQFILKHRLSDVLNSTHENRSETLQHNRLNAVSFVLIKTSKANKKLHW